MNTFVFVLQIRFKYKLPWPLGVEVRSQRILDHLRLLLRLRHLMVFLFTLVLKDIIEKNKCVNIYSSRNTRTIYVMIRII